MEFVFHTYMEFTAVGNYVDMINEASVLNYSEQTAARFRQRHR